MRRSISLIAWPPTRVDLVAPRLAEVGMEGLEVAPTAVWDVAPRVSASEVERYARDWAGYGLAVSGIQSLLYGRPDLQLFDRTTWPALREHLLAMVRIAHGLGASVAVFGSPRNRQRGLMETDKATYMAAEFLAQLVPALEAYDITLTLEPNAPEYGADFITRYLEAVTLAELVDSPWIRPQIDTGCLAMVGDDPAAGVRASKPAHVHVSAPSLLPPPGPVDHAALRTALAESHYDGWVVLEMLQFGSDPVESAVESARWLTETYSVVKT